MNTSLLWKALILFLLSPTSLFSQIRNGTFVVRPKEIDDVRNNPGIGFTTFQRFNGDTLSELNNKLGWTEGHPIVYHPSALQQEQWNLPKLCLLHIHQCWSLWSLTTFNLFTAVSLVEFYSENKRR